MNQFLLNNLSENRLRFKELFDCEPDSDVSRPYFFLKRELLVTNLRHFKAEKAVGGIRHAIEYKGKWFDYIIKREFNTLADWATDAGAFLDEILYGTNRVHQQDFDKTTKNNIVYRKPVYVTLERLLRCLNFPIPAPIQIPIYKPFDTFTDILKELDMIDNRKCLVHNSITNTIVISQLVDQKHYELEDTESKICLIVPQDNQYITDVYSSLSEMPEGNEVYFRVADGSFHSVAKLLNL